MRWIEALGAYVRKKGSNNQRIFISLHFYYSKFQDFRAVFRTFFLCSNSNMQREKNTLQSDVNEWLKTAEKPVIVVLGPTASGKTDYSIRLAHSLNSDAPHPNPLSSFSAGFLPAGNALRKSALKKRNEEGQATSGWKIEIINADSRQLYKYLDIGTAKITDKVMNGIPHHLLSVLDPKEKLTVAWYKEQADRVIADIHFRKHLPILVGGSMLYISAVIDNFEMAPPPSEESRTRLEQEYDKDDGDTLYKKLQERDPEAATSFSKENKRYLVRALEMYESTGKTKSQLRKEDSQYDVFIIGMNVERKILHDRIEKRTEKMFSLGWIDEVKELMKRGYSEKDPGMESHGYREIIQVINGDLPLEEAKKIIIKQGKDYAKRQMTWWKRDDRIQWI